MSHPRDLTLDEAFVIPQAGELSALDFVIRLDSERQQAAMQRLVDDYVVTPAVEEALPGLFAHMKTAVTRGEAYGHILHGGFGSGKSHLMTMISLLLERNPAAWNKVHPAFEALRQEHRGWVADRELLVVRVHMLSARRAGAALDEILYDAVNHSLVAAGKAPMLVSGAVEVVAELKAEAAMYGESFWRKADQHAVAASMEEVEMMEEAGEEAINQLAQAYLAMKGRTMGAHSLKPPWGEGLQRLTQHIKAEGFGGLVLLIDEFLLWLAEKAGEDFVSAINDMNTIVDFGGGRRAAPVIVVFARQKNIREFFPELTDQDRIQDRVDHHAKRFEVTQLQDVELRYIVAGRVLRQKKEPAAIDAAREEVLRTYRRAIDDLVGEAGPEVLQDVFPFHPALIDVLVDVSNLMQRERSALRLLYELLSANRHLPLSQLLPVGRAFEHVFPEAGVEAARKTEVLQKIHREWYQVLSRRIEAFVARRGEDGEPVSEERAHALRQAIKTVLLGLVSPRLAGKGNERLTVERLAKLNFADADGDRLSRKIGRLHSDLTDFGIYFCPELQITGEKGDAVVSYALGQASLGEVLRRAEGKVSGKHTLLTEFGGRLGRLLPKGLEGLVSSKDGLKYEVIWRGTKRKGSVVFGNVRELGYATFEPAPGEAFRVLVDYPWDDPGHTVGEDIARVASVRKKRGNLPTAAWLPRHFSSQEERLLRELAAAQWVVKDGVGGELLASYGRDERTLLLEQARNRAEVLQRQVDEAILEAYDQQAEVKALNAPRDPDLGTGSIEGDLQRIVREILDRRFPQHPNFQRSSDDKREEASRKALQAVEAFMRRAWGESGSIHFEGDTAEALERVARPLELADVGQSRAAIQHHGRFVKEVLGELGDHHTVAWTPVAEKLRDSPYGLTQEVIDLLLVYVCLKGYRLRSAAGDRLDPKVGLGGGAYTLEKAQLLGLPDWSRVRTLGQQILRITPADAHRSLSAQDRLAGDLGRAAQETREALSALHERLVKLGAGESERLAEVKTLLEKLSPLVKRDADSFGALTLWLSAWPEEDASLRAQVRAVSLNNTVLDDLDTTSRGHLLRARGGRLASRISAILDELDERLRSREQVRPLRAKDIAAFNEGARKIVSELLEGTGPGPQPPPDPPPPPTPGVKVERVDLRRPTAGQLQELVRRLEEAVESGELESIEVVLRRRETSR